MAGWPAGPVSHRPGPRLRWPGQGHTEPGSFDNSAQGLQIPAAKRALPTRGEAAASLPGLAVVLILHLDCMLNYCESRAQGCRAARCRVLALRAHPCWVAAANLLLCSSFRAIQLMASSGAGRPNRRPLSGMTRSRDCYLHHVAHVRWAGPSTVPLSILTVFSV